MLKKKKKIPVILLPPFQFQDRGDMVWLPASHSPAVNIKWLFQMLTQKNIFLETGLTDSIGIQFCCHINQETLNVAPWFPGFGLSSHWAFCLTLLYHYVPLDVTVTHAFGWQKQSNPSALLCRGKNLQKWRIMLCGFQYKDLFTWHFSLKNRHSVYCVIWLLFPFLFLKRRKWIKCGSSRECTFPYILTNS